MPKNDNLDLDNTRTSKNEESIISEHSRKVGLFKGKRKSIKGRIFNYLKRTFINILRPVDRPKTVGDAIWPKNASLFTKVMNIVILCMVIAFVFMKSSQAGTTKANPKYSEILNKIDNNIISYFWDEPKYSEILQLPSDMLDSFVRRRKPTFARFDADLLFSKMAKDTEYTYTVYIDFEYSSPNFRKCMISKDNNLDITSAKICRNKILICLGKKDASSIDSADLSRCIDKNKECVSLKKLDPGTSISKEYCEKLYGRKL